MKPIYLLLILLAFSCKSKKVTTDIQRESTTEQSKEVKTLTDTIYKDRVIIKTLPIYSETLIESPCDSLGNLRPMNTTIGSGGNRSSVNTLNGQLVLRQYIDSTTQQSELIKRLQYRSDSLIAVNSVLKESNKSSDEKVYVYPWNYYAVMAAAILFFILWVSKYVIRVYKWFNPLV